MASDVQKPFQDAPEVDLVAELGAVEATIKQEDIEAAARSAKIARLGFEWDQTMQVGVQIKGMQANVQERAMAKIQGSLDKVDSLREKAFQNPILKAEFAKRLSRKVRSVQTVKELRVFIGECVQCGLLTANRRKVDSELIPQSVKPVLNGNETVAKAVQELSNAVHRKGFELRKANQGKKKGKK